MSPAVSCCSQRHPRHRAPRGTGWSNVHRDTQSREGVGDEGSMGSAPVQPQPPCPALQGGWAQPRGGEWRVRQRECSLHHIKPDNTAFAPKPAQVQAGIFIWYYEWLMGWKVGLVPPKQPSLIPKCWTQAASGGNMGRSISTSHFLGYVEAALTFKGVKGKDN